MHTKEIEKNIFLIDLETGGFKNLFGSYILKGTRTIIVETGPSSSIPNLLSGLEEIDIRVENVAYIALSHVHLDHGGGAGSLLKFLPNAKILVHPRGVPHLVNPDKLWLQSKEVLGHAAEVFGEPDSVPKDRIIAGSNGLTLDVGNRVLLTAVETLGHASYNLSYCESLHGGIFPGDAAGIYLCEFDAVIPTTPPPFRLDAALSSLHKLIKLKPSALYYSHFGKVSNVIKRLQNYCQQLRLWARITKEEVKNGHDLEEIQRRILEEDKVMQKAASFIKSNSFHERTMLENNVQGFIDYIKKHQI